MAVKKPANRSASRKATVAAPGRILVRNVNVPDHITSVDAAKYEAMRKALWKVLPKKDPGLTQTEMCENVLPHLPEDLFPGGKTAGWWVKAVQLDQEAVGGMVRDKGKPLRWRRV